MWLVWILVGAGLEAYSAATHKRTLSQQVWRWTEDSWWKRGAVLAFLSWLTAHFVWKI